MKDLYAYYHKRHFGYEKLYRGFRRKNFVCNLSAGKFIISAAVAGGITLNPVVIATLTGVGLILKAVASLKKYDKKTEQANFARIEYQNVLDEICFYLRGEAFDEKVFLDRLKMIDNFVTDHCMEIPPSICKKYESVVNPLWIFKVIIYANKMIALFAAICYWFFELLTPPEIKQIRFITRDCVSNNNAPHS